MKLAKTILLTSDVWEFLEDESKKYKKSISEFLNDFILCKKNAEKPKEVVYSLIECPNCKASYSNKLNSCPNCSLMEIKQQTEKEKVTATQKNIYENEIKELENEFKSNLNKWENEEIEREIFITKQKDIDARIKWLREQILSIEGKTA